jgi:hypothetical protein
MTTFPDSRSAAALASASREGRTTAAAETRRLLDLISRDDPAAGAFRRRRRRGRAAPGRGPRFRARGRASPRSPPRGPRRLQGSLLHRRAAEHVRYRGCRLLDRGSRLHGCAAPDGCRRDHARQVRMTELAMGTFGVNDIQGTPRNPHAPAGVMPLSPTPRLRNHPGDPSRAVKSPQSYAEAGATTAVQARGTRCPPAACGRRNGEDPGTRVRWVEDHAGPENQLVAGRMGFRRGHRACRRSGLTEGMFSCIDPYPFNSSAPNPERVLTRSRSQRGA